MFRPSLLLRDRPDDVQRGRRRRNPAGWSRSVLVDDGSLPARSWIRPCSESVRFRSVGLFGVAAFTF